jgi:hypothetical protein
LTATTEQNAAADRAAEAAHELRSVGEQVIAVCETLRPLTERLAALEAQHRAAMTAAGMSCHCVPARSAATDVILAACEPLRPYVRFTSQGGGERAARYLTQPCACVPAKKRTTRRTER